MFKRFLYTIPTVRWVRNRIVLFLTRHNFTTSAAYWESRYTEGGTSGSGSYGLLAEFKAEVLNKFVEKYQITSVIEFGCGDGNQLLLARYPKYIGLDVSRKAISLCWDKFRNDSTKSFFYYDPDYFMDSAGVFRAELALSLDVIYHLVEDHVFIRYMELLFQSSRRFVIIYSSNYDEITCSPHERERHFTDYVAINFKDWELIEKIENRYPMSIYPAPIGSNSDFYIYKKKEISTGINKL